MIKQVIVVFFLLLTINTHSISLAENNNQVTIIYDSFSKPNDMKKDWGFSALIEFDGKKILFDAGNNVDTFKPNIKAANVNLIELDFVVISHRHGDHTTGISYLLEVIPDIPIYVPIEKLGIFGGNLPSTFYPTSCRTTKPYADI